MLPPGGNGVSAWSSTPHLQAATQLVDAQLTPPRCGQAEVVGPGSPPGGVRFKSFSPPTTASTIFEDAGGAIFSYSTLDVSDIKSVKDRGQQTTLPKNLNILRK